MNKYEIMFIVNPTLDEASIKKVAEDMKDIIVKAKGEITEEQEMGQRDLAYEINKHKKGYYFFYAEKRCPKKLESGMFRGRNYTGCNNNRINSATVRFRNYGGSDGYVLHEN